MIKIEINCDPEALDAHIRALGLMRNPSAWMKNPTPVTNGHADGKPEVVVTAGDMMSTSRAAAGDGYATAPEIKVIFPNGEPSSSMTTILPTAETIAAPSATGRIPGQPSPGRKRRTREEVEADKAYFELHKEMEQESAAEPEPDAASVDPAVVAQDEADEAAETAERKSDKPTLEDVRKAVSVWSAKVGAATAVNTLRTLLGCSLIELKEEDYAAAIAKLAGAGAPEPAPKTKEDVIAAIKAYGRKYDGTDNPEKMERTKVDLPKVFQATFSDSVTGLGSMPQTADAFERIVAAIEAATNSNLFGREAK
jgi:hypothetical protein